MVKFTRPIAVGLAGLALVAGAACSSSGTAANSAATQATSGSSAAAIVPVQQRSDTQQSGREMTTADLVKQAGSAVVRIETGGGVGTGFVVSNDGYIITNNHVVQPTATGTRRGSSGIQVTLVDGSQVQAKLVGADARSDLAVIKVDQTGLTALKIGTLDNVAVGQDVVAIGFALDLGGGELASFSVTRGIISAKNRSISESSPILGAIQTDAAINHGNSGGPLLDMTGQVVGVNTAIAPDNSTGGIASGIGFAVGADTVKAVFDEIKANGKVNRGLLGITNFAELRPAKAKDLGLAGDQRGVLLNSDSIAAGGPAAGAGLKANDVITKLGNSVIRNEADLAVALIQNHAGEKVTVEFMRDGKKSSVQLTLGTPAT